MHKSNEKLEQLISDLYQLDYIVSKEPKNKNIYLVTQQLYFNYAQQQQNLDDQKIFNEAKIKRENFKFNQVPLTEQNEEVKQKVTYFYKKLQDILDALVDIQEINFHFQGQSEIHPSLLIAINKLVLQVNLAIAIFWDCEQNIEKNEFQVLQNCKLEINQIFTELLRKLTLPNDQKIKECINEFDLILCQKSVMKSIELIEINNQNYNQIEYKQFQSMQNQDSTLLEVYSNNLKKEDFEKFIQIRIQKIQEFLRLNFPNIQSQIYNIFGINR